MVAGSILTEALNTNVVGGGGERVRAGKGLVSWSVFSGMPM